MKLIRFDHNHKTHFGHLKDDKVYTLDYVLFDTFEETGEVLNLSNVTILPPVQPTKIVAVGLNYLDHIRELNLKVPEQPIIFMKPTSALNPHQSPIVLPAMSNQVEYEGELALVIKRTATNISVRDAASHIFGYLCFNDVTARDLQKKDGHFTRAKSFNTFACVGPFIETEVKDPTNLQIKTRLNGNLMQNSSTANMRFNVFEIVSYISQIMTLHPGDVITTGSPAGVHPLKHGDQVEVAIDGVGSLSNPVHDSRNGAVS